MNEYTNNNEVTEEYELPEDFDEYCEYVGSKEWEEDYYGGFDN